MNPIEGQYVVVLLLKLQVEGNSMQGKVPAEGDITHITLRNALALAIVKKRKEQAKEIQASCQARKMAQLTSSFTHKFHPNYMPLPVGTQ